MLSLTSAAVVAAVALLAPLVVGLTRLPVPEVVLQILLGIVVGPQVLGWAGVDAPVRVLSVLGLGFLLLLSGLDVDIAGLRGRVLGLTSAAFVLSFALALMAGVVLGAAGLVRSPLLIAVILSATSLGIVLPPLEDAGQIGTPFGQVVVAGASIAEVVPVVLLSVLFSADAAGIGSQLALLVTFLAFVLALALLVAGVERSTRVSRTLLALQETTAEIRVRGAVTLLMVLAAVAASFGLEAILGAFLAGATIRLLDRDETMTHGLFRTKLKAVGFGAFVPFFFVATGMTLDVRALVTSPATLAKVPVFLAALLVARGLPVVLYRSLADGRRQLVAAGLLQATSLSIPIVAGSIGVQLGLVRPDNYVALVAAGLLSVLVLPPLAVPRLAAVRPGPGPGPAGRRPAGS